MKQLERLEASFDLKTQQLEKADSIKKKILDQIIDLEVQFYTFARTKLKNIDSVKDITFAPRWLSTRNGVFGFHTHIPIKSICIHLKNGNCKEFHPVPGVETTSIFDIYMPDVEINHDNEFCKKTLLETNQDTKTQSCALAEFVSCLVYESKKNE